MNMIDWLRATSEWMYKDRPDLFSSPSAAFLRLEEWVENLRGLGVGTIETGGFCLSHSFDDGVEEWTLLKKIATCELFTEESAANAFSWVQDSGTMTIGPNLPDVSALDFDFGLDNDV